MAIANLVKSNGYLDKPSIAGMFGKASANDNLVKDSGLFSESFIVSASTSIMQLNDNLSKLQESSLSITKSIDSVVSKIRTLDNDMTQRFKRLNADIAASRPEFGKFLYKAPSVPLEDFAPGIIEKGKAAKLEGGGLGPAAAAAAAAAAAGLGGGGTRRFPQTPRTQTPPTQTPGGGGKGTTGSGKDAVKTAPRPPPTARASSPAAGTSSRSPASPRSASGTPVRTERPPQPRDPKTGRFVKVTSAIDGKTAAAAALDRADKVFPPALSRAIGPLAGVVITGMAYVKYQDAVKQYDTDIENKVDPKKAKETLDESIAEIIGETVGSLLGGFGGAAIGGALGTAVPGIGNIFGMIGGGIIGSTVGNDIGMIIGKSVGDTYKDDSVNFGDAFKKRFSVFSKERNEETQKAATSAVGGRAARMRQRAGLPPLPESAGAPPSAPATPDTTTPPPPPADSASSVEKKEEGGETGSKTAPIGEAVSDPTKVKGKTPQSSSPAPSTPAAPPPTPRADRTSGGGADVQVNTTTNASSTTQGGENQNVTNPNLALNAQNEFLKTTLSRQMINIA